MHLFITRQKTKWKILRENSPNNFQLEKTPPKSVKGYKLFAPNKATG
jgi:hypothetical protein